MVTRSDPANQQKPKPEFIGIVGPPWCGKTSLVRALRRTAECLPRTLQIADYSLHVHGWHINPDNESPLRELAMSHEEHRRLGNMIPDHEVEKLLLSYFYSREQMIAEELKMIRSVNELSPHVSRIICSGWPRTTPQVESMSLHFSRPTLVMLDAPFEVLNALRHKRIEESKARGDIRSDDVDEKTVQNRWRIYREVTEPAIMAFGGRVIRIDASLELTKKLKRFIRECIPSNEEVMRASMFSKFLPHPRNPERGRPDTEATRFIAHIELGAPYKG